MGEFFGLIEESISKVNHYFKTVFRTFRKHKQYIKNALETHYSNAKQNWRGLISLSKILNVWASVLEILSTLGNVFSYTKREDLSGPL